jgi:uncharacterized protein (TIGR03086 family)
MIDLEPAAREVLRLVDGVADERLGDPTPCEGMPVAVLLDHLMGLSLAFTWAARKTTPEDGGPRPGAASAEQLDPGWRTALPGRLAGLVEAWREPGAWQGMAAAGGVEMPAEQMGVVALDELVMHGWDLARATGQEFTCDPADAAAVLAFTQAIAGQGAPREGLFGPAVEVPENASDLERALGFAGRDPAWRRVSA